MSRSVIHIEVWEMFLCQCVLMINLNKGTVASHFELWPCCHRNRSTLVSWHLNRPWQIMFCWLVTCRETRIVQVLSLHLAVHMEACYLPTSGWNTHMLWQGEYKKLVVTPVPKNYPTNCLNNKLTIQDCWKFRPRNTFYSCSFYYLFLSVHISVIRPSWGGIYNFDFRRLLD
jgi:hypothetical protein